MPSTIDTQIADINSISQAYGDANTYYKNITPNNALVYKEITSDYNTPPKLVDVGCICNTEYTSFSFNMKQYWDADTIVPNLKNAQKMINDVAWGEQSNLHNGSIQATPGMVVLSKDASTYIQDNTAFFNDQLKNAKNATATNFNNFSAATSGGNGIAIDLFGYFHPDATGAWKFTIPTSNSGTDVCSYLWVGDSALFDYRASNADIYSTITKTTPQNYKIFNLIKDDYVPFRIQFISKSGKYTGTIFNVTPPSNSAVKGGVIINNPGQGWDYFVTFIKNGAIYYKNQLYFGIVTSDADPQRANCFFVDALDAENNGANAQNIRDYKTNPQLQYVKADVITPAMTGSSQISVQDGDPVNLVFMPGVTITITSATYGLPQDFAYDVYTDRQVSVDVPEATDENTIKVPNVDPSVPVKIVSITTKDHIKTVVFTVKDVTHKTAKQSIDVTSAIQGKVANGYTLAIPAGTGNFGFLGDPIEETVGSDTKNPNKNNPNVKKTLLINLTFTVEDRLITEKTLSVSSKTGKIILSSVFNGFNVFAEMPMNVVPPACTGDCSKYRMKLDDDGLLKVLDNNGTMVGNIDLTESGKKFDPGFTIDRCQVNVALANDASIQSELLADVTISRSNGNKMKSPKGKFKMGFENNKLKFTFCYTPYTEITYNGAPFRYTTPFNVSNMNNSQILYLYRIDTHGLMGRKFLNETDASTGETILHYLPNTHSNILYESNDPTKFTKWSNSPAYPLMNNGKISYPDRYSTITNAGTYNACANQCIQDANCEHFFFLTKNDKTTQCYTDTASDPNPAYTLTNLPGNNFTDSNVYKKPYNIKTTCGRMTDGQQLQYSTFQTIPETVSIDYRVPENAPNMTYYCGLDRYKSDNQTALNTYNKEPFGNLKEGFTDPTTPPPPPNVDVSQFHPNAPYEKDHVQYKFPVLNALTDYYSKLQDQVGAQYDQTIDKLRKYEEVYTVVSSPQFKENSSDTLIPDQFINNPNPKPKTSLVEGTKRDVGVMLMQQNTMYTLASITAATCLILGVMFGGSGGSE